MRDHKVWALIENAVTNNHPAALMIVIDSQGSSPGRQGFKMAVDTNGNLAGSVGGGTMEHDLVEKSKQLLSEHHAQPVILRQEHRTEAESKHCSGMICSGSQMVVIYPVSYASKEIFTRLQQPITNTSALLLQMNPAGITLLPADATQKIARYSYKYESDMNWCYQENLAQSVHSPIGIGIHSKTPEEIAISIAAEIIQCENGVSL